MERIGVGLLGLGTVGSGVARLLLEAGDRLAHRAGRRIELVRVAVRDLNRPRTVELPTSLLTNDPADIVNDPRVDIVVETIGGTNAARRWVLEAHSSGKDVVTANKALLAEHGTEVFTHARR